MEIVNKIGLEKVNKADIILPVCSKSCYNAMLRNRKDADKVARKEKNYNSNQLNVRWDSDGGNGKLLSEEVIVQWLTTNENSDRYFGGVIGQKKRTNGTLKDTYHWEQ